MNASDLVAKAAAEIRAHMANGDRNAAKEVIKDLANKVPFPRLDDVLAEYDDPDYRKTLWGMWGPGEDLVMSGTASVEESFCDNAGMLMSTKGMAEGRTLGAMEIGVQGAMRSEDTSSDCPLCPQLDGMTVPYPSEEFDALDAPAHCNCEFLWIYIDAEESNFNPDTTMNDIEDLKPLIDKHGKDLPIYANSKDKLDSEAAVSAGSLQQIWDDFASDFEDEGETE